MLTVIAAVASLGEQVFIEEIAAQADLTTNQVFKEVDRLASAGLMERTGRVGAQIQFTRTASAFWGGCLDLPGVAPELPENVKRLHD